MTSESPGARARRDRLSVLAAEHRQKPIRPPVRLVQLKKTLRERCRQLLDALQANEPLVFGEDDLDVLESFILVEIARGAAPEFAGAKPLVLFFESDADREGVIDAFRAEHPNAKQIKVNP